MPKEHVAGTIPGQEAHHMSTSTTGTGLVGNLSDLLGAAEKSASARKVGDDMDKDAFLKLLVTQLKNQDPMKPMQDTEFIGQMAQFSSLEQMQNMNKLIEAQNSFAQLSQASGLIGKEVTLVKPGEDAEAVTGVVDEVRQTGGQTFVVVGGEAYEASLIHTVGKTGEASGTATKTKVEDGTQYIPYNGGSSATGDTAANTTTDTTTETPAAT
jgi:flagellar basal-body rod modification protein FlgD